MRKIKGIVEYDGTHFYGSQVQKDKRTVQDEIEKAIKGVTQESLRVRLAGRTDRGVHARGQVFHFETGSILSLLRLCAGFNAHLPRDVVIKKLSQVSKKFHAQYSAKGKVYVYSIHAAHCRAPLKSATHWEVFKSLDFDLMKKTVALFEGTHDFRAFCNKANRKENTVRTIHKARIVKKGENIIFTISGDGFLYRMVRNIMGALVSVGEGKLTSDDVKKIIAGKCRTKAPKAAPAHGLTLEKVHY